MAPFDGMETLRDGARGTLKRRNGDKNCAWTWIFQNILDLISAGDPVNVYEVNSECGPRAPTTKPECRDVVKSVNRWRLPAPVSSLHAGACYS